MAAKEYTDQQKALLRMREIWDLATAHAWARGMTDEGAAQFAKMQLEKILLEAQTTTK